MSRLTCQTCSYSYAIRKTRIGKVELKKKQVDDVLGGAEAWENVDKAQSKCGDGSVVVVVVVVGERERKWWEREGGEKEREGERERGREGERGGYICCLLVLTQLLLSFSLFHLFPLLILLPFLSLLHLLSLYISPSSLSFSLSHSLSLILSLSLSLSLSTSPLSQVRAQRSLLLPASDAFCR